MVVTFEDASPWPISLPYHLHALHKVHCEPGSKQARENKVRTKRKIFMQTKFRWIQSSFLRRNHTHVLGARTSEAIGENAEANATNAMRRKIDFIMVVCFLTRTVCEPTRRLTFLWCILEVDARRFYQFEHIIVILMMGLPKKEGTTDEFFCIPDVRTWRTSGSYRAVTALLRVE